ncbi:uncharacterized protein CTHT_0058000 [Thermochaetoides thermophila DSM 1495]|uniref:Mitochondrial carrier protein n=1 Tax=Chaetomium thermophilum (strain DSM 1495 / CBS 144.50 / IMI 039719) TaxID=759272 RepID=G0SCP9_CHATD|nr:hypothetical protein CTHT_0058000 [Thermochaetoides thermophila DSM 1495]EGS19175.1 hypothetical protein CTHT_0058000 [Thermochaetoides thermophila DSM 1495]
MPFFPSIQANTTAIIKPEPGHIKLCSGQHYAACTLVGLLVCGLTHTLITPLDLAKVRRHVDSSLYPSSIRGLQHIYRHELGLRGIFTGWVPTFLGYSAQSSFK